MKFTTGMVRLSYAHLFAPAADLNGDEKYSASFIIPKNSKTVGIVKKAMEELLAQPETQKVLGKTKNFSHPLLRDGDEDRPDDEAYKDAFFLNAKSNLDHKPKVLTRDLTAVADPDEVYSGCYVQAVLNIYPYNKGGNKGIGASLMAVRKVKDGEPLTGSVVSENDFDDSLLEDMNDIF